MHKVKYADVTVVKNEDKKPTANKTYLHVNTGWADLLFTEKEVERAQKRAEKNTEDLQFVGWVRRALLKFLYAFK